MNRDEFRKAFEKVLYSKLESLPEGKALLWPDLDIAFYNFTGERLQDYAKDIPSIIEELKKKRFVRFETLPNGMIRILKGINFDEWKVLIVSNNQTKYNIGVISGHKVQIGDKNIMEINISCEDFIKYLNRLIENPKDGKTIIDKLTEYAKSGVGLIEVVNKFIELSSSIFP